MTEALCKLILFVVAVVATITLFNGHSEHIKRLSAGLNKPVSYHTQMESQLVCNGVVVANGIVMYEEGKDKSRSSSNSTGVWRIGDSVYKQKEGEVCSKRKI